MSRPTLTALPVFNEERHIPEVLPEVIRYSEEVLVVNDGSSDDTAGALAKFPDIHVIHHDRNRGYGAALRTAFDFARENDYEALVTIDCDGQHEPELIPRLVATLQQAPSHGAPLDLVSGSRYLTTFTGDSQPPPERREINLRITAILNECLALDLTDAFCGFKAYRVASLGAFDITELGYAMPLQHWVQAVAANLKITEFPVPLVYLEEERSFGGSLDNARQRMRYYREVLARELARHQFPIHEELRDPVGCT